LPLWYEDILINPKNCVIKSLNFLTEELTDTDICSESIFKKIGNDKNKQFYDTFLSNKANLEYLAENGLGKERFEI
ncbi:MAG: hypothetical protein KAJ63_09230, partial [Methyloprofundus sp.]|nr:hypothetical protein [Methyloprofundus sp.]